MRFSHDNASFSVNTDDPTVTNTKLSDEYNLLRNWGITEEQIKQCVSIMFTLGFIQIVVIFFFAEHRSYKKFFCGD